jgi:hypothetical protein
LSPASERRDPRRFATVSASIALALVALFALTARAQATENLYWDNYGDNPDTLAFANIDGSGGGQLNTGSEPIESPEGMAYDTVTNRLFVTTGSGASRHILAVNLDGSGASIFAPPGAPVAEPEGVAVDPATRTIYWANTKTGATSIAWANLDGAGGGTLNTSGVTVESPCCRVAVDPTGGRVYWVNNSSGTSSIAYANLNNTGGGGQLNLSGSTVAPGGEGVIVDSAAGRVYFLGAIGPEETIGYANVNGSGGGNVSLAGATMKTSWGLAFDPAFNRLYWGNEGNAEVKTNAFGFVNVGGGSGGINIATAPVANPQEPVVLKSPIGTGVPSVTRNPKNRAALSCSTGSWGADAAGGFVYQAPRTFTYQWLREGKPVSGATSATFNAKSAGKYTCVVAATNQTGTASQTSAAITVKASKVKLTTKKKVDGVPGGVVSFKIKAANQGDIKSKQARVCVKLPNSAKGLLKAPKCKSLGKLTGQGKKSSSLKIKIGSAAHGTYKVTFQVKGASGKAAKAKIVVK